MPPKTTEQLAALFREDQRRDRKPMPLPMATGVAAQPSQTQGTLPEPQTQAPVQTEPAATLGPTGFVSFASELAANQDAANRMAQQAAQQAVSGRNVGMLGSQEGRQALLKQAYGKAAQLSDLDAALAGAAGGNEFQQLERMYGAAGQAQAAQRAKDNAIQQQIMSQRGVQLQNPSADKQVAQGWKGGATTGAEGVANEAQRIRAEDAGRQRGQVTREQWANMHGMTLEQWIQGGKKPAY